MRSHGLAVAGVVLTGALVLFMVLSTISLLTGASSTKTTIYQGKDLERSGEDLLFNTSSEGLVPPVVTISSVSLSEVRVRVEVHCDGVLIKEEKGTTPLTVALPQTPTGGYTLTIRILTEDVDASDLSIEIKRTDILAAGAFCLLSCFFFLFVPLLWVSSLTLLISAAFIKRQELKDAYKELRTGQYPPNIQWTKEGSYRGGGQ